MLAAVLCLLAAAAPARADTPEARDRADQILREAAGEAREALRDAPRAAAARDGLARAIAGGRVDVNIVRDVVRNPFAGPVLLSTLEHLGTVHDVPGVNSILDRMARARDSAGPRGGAFEIEVGARLRPRLASIGGMYQGHEVDAILTDGTIVEAKHILSKKSGKAIGKAIQQLQVRGAGRQVPGMLIVNVELNAAQIRKVESRLSGKHEVAVMQVTSSGIRRQGLGPRAIPTPQDATADRARVQPEVRTSLRRASSRSYRHSRDRPGATRNRGTPARVKAATTPKPRARARAR